MSLSDRFGLLIILLFGALSFDASNGYPTDERFSEGFNPGAHQLASWLAYQLRNKEVVPIQEGPLIPYRLPLQLKRNSEVTNALLGSEDSQKMYRDGRK